MRAYSENWSVRQRVSSSSNYAEIKKVGELLNKGLLSQKELEAKKIDSPH